MNLHLIRVLKQLNDIDLKILISVAQKEQRRRKAIKNKNETWACNDGLIHVLKASLKNK